MSKKENKDKKTMKFDFNEEINKNLTDLKSERKTDKKKKKKARFFKNLTLEEKQKIIHYITIFGLILTVIATLVLYFKGYLTDQDKLVKAVESTGILAPITFFLIQIFQVVVPIIPGGVTSIAGVVIFGPFWGFILNYSGILIGSCINFYLGRVYGTSFLKMFLNEKNYAKYSRWVEGDNKFPLFFGVSMFLPGFPDDIICIIAGINQMTFRKFFIIYNLTKPFGLFGYSMFFAYFPDILNKLSDFFSR